MIARPFQLRGKRHAAVPPRVLPQHIQSGRTAMAGQAGWTLSREWISAQPRFAIFLLSAA